MKIGSPSRVDEMYRFGQKGLYFAYAAVPPAALPSGDEFVYFDLGREQKQDAQQKEEWKKVEDERGLAIRFNDAYLPGGIPQGKQEITIRVDGATMANMQFTLFVVPQER
jgi:predicted component of type VI protein secretion system